MEDKIGVDIQSVIETQVHPHISLDDKNKF